MLIKIIIGDIESDWIKHTRKEHIVMLDNPPEKVRIRIRDFYVKSPDREATEVISFDLFCLLARQFVLDQNADKRQDSRNLDGREFDEFDVSAFNMDKHITKMDLHRALDTLTETQRRRVKLHFFDGLTYKQIAKIEGAFFTSIAESINNAVTKIKKYFSDYP